MPQVVMSWLRHCRARTVFQTPGPRTKKGNPWPLPFPDTTESLVSLASFVSLPPDLLRNVLVRFLSKRKKSSDTTSTVKRKKIHVLAHSTSGVDPWSLAMSLWICGATVFHGSNKSQRTLFTLQPGYRETPPPSNLLSAPRSTPPVT